MEEFIKHQKLTQERDFDVKYLTIGLCGEVGEVCNEIKKMEKIKLEMGDVLWYYIGICNKLRISFNEILELNYKKLKSYDDYDEIVQRNNS